MERNEDGWFGRIAMIVAVTLGLSTAGTLMTRSSGGGSTAAAMPAAEPAANRPAAAPATSPHALAPGAMTRPLSLIADFIEPGPMFEMDEADRVLLSRAYREALDDARIPIPQGLTAAAGAQAQGVQRPSVFQAPSYAPTERALIEHVRGLTDQLGIEVHFVVATVPDWVDSTLQWSFDPLLDSIQMAAGQMGYVPTSFHMPDADAGASPASAARAKLRKAHESEPGAILFRRAREPAPAAPGVLPRTADRSPVPELLLVLLVGETATGGAHPRALAAALDLVLLWQTRDWLPNAFDGAAEHAMPVRILGPSYSGSAMPLRAALESAVVRHRLAPERGPWFDLVTPSATSPDNPRYLERPGISRFRATTRSDDEALYALAHFLGRTDPAWRCGKRVALLVEANTTWGRRFFEDRGGVSGGDPYSLLQSPALPKGGKDSPCWRCVHAGPNEPLDESVPLMPCAAVLPFPLHISRLRSEAALLAKPQSPVAVPSQATVSLQMTETSMPVDRVPSFSPVLTAANVETMLHGVFRAIEERGITAIGVLATDKRDHVFLAQEITRRTPNVLPFTIESNLIYVHPDVASYVRGTVVASTYSLYDRTQFLTRPTLANHFRQQFGSVAAHGAFNALAALLGEYDQMLDYDTPAGPGEPVPDRAMDGPCKPGRKACRPPVWISVVGRGALLPLTSAPPSAERDTEYAALAPNTGIDRKGRKQQDYLGEHLPFQTMVTVVLCLLAWHAWLVWRNRLQDLSVASLRQERLAGRFAREGAAIAILLWLAKLWMISTADSRAIPPLQLMPLFAGLCTFAGGYMVLRALEAFWRIDTRGTRLAAGALVAFVVAMLFWCLWPEPGPRIWAANAAAAMALLAAFGDLPRERGWRALEDVAYWRRLPVVLGIGAVTALLCHLVIDAWRSADAVLYADRTGLLESLASPAPVIVMLCGAVYWWGAWNLRRVQLMQLPEAQVGVGELLFGRARRGGALPIEVFQQPTLTVGGFMLLPAALTLYALLAGERYVGSVDGRLFGGFLLLGAACVMAITGHTLAHTLHLGNAILGTLRALGRHPAAEVFKTLGKEPFDWRLSFGKPKIPDFEPLVRRVQLAAAGGRDCSEEDDRLATELGLAPRYKWILHADTIVKSMKFDRLDAATGGVMRVSDWRELDELTRDFKDVLRRTRWRAGFEGTGFSPAYAQTLEHMEYIVMFHGAIVLRDLLTRLVSGFTAVVGGLLLLMSAHLLYTFQGRAFWLTLDWIAIGVAGIVAIRVLLRLEKDVVLSRLWNTTPGKITAFGGLSWRMLAYFAITLVALFAAFFPEVGGGIAKWLDPVRKVMP